MSQPVTKNFQKFPFKAFGKLGGALAAAVAVEYAICYGVAAVANSTLLHGSLSAPRAALGLLALTLLARRILGQSVKPQRPSLELPPLSPADLAKFSKRFDETFPGGNGSPKATPYL